MWTKVEESKLFKRYRAILQRVYKMPSGKKVDFDIIDIGESAHVLALTANSEVILVKEFRPGPERILTELPAGMLNKDEPPLAAAERELLEETGYSGKAQYVAKVFRHPYSTEVIHIIVCTNCIKVKEAQPDDSEIIETCVVPLTEFRNLLKTGEPTNALVGYIGLDYLKLLEQRET